MNTETRPNGGPFAHLLITRYITAQIEALKGEKSQREIAAEMGYDKPNMISMLKSGATRVPLEKIPALAKALHVDLGHLFRIAMEDYWPGQRKALSEIMRSVGSANERELLEEWRKLTGNRDYALTPELKTRLRKALQGYKP